MCLLRTHICKIYFVYFKDFFLLNNLFLKNFIKEMFRLFYVSLKETEATFKLH